MAPMSKQIQHIHKMRKSQNSDFNFIIIEKKSKKLP